MYIHLQICQRARFCLLSLDLMTILGSKYGHKTCISSAFIFDNVHLRLKMFSISLGMQYLSHHSVYFVIEIVLYF